MSILFPFLVILILVLLNGVFVAAEFAIIGVRPTRVEQLAEEGDRTAIGLRKIVKSPAQVDRYIATCQLGITLASLGLGMYAEPQIAHLLEPFLHDVFHIEGDTVHTISFFIALAFITYLHVVIGEMIPKAMALQNSERVVMTLALPMRLFQGLFSWAVTALNAIGLWVLKLARIPLPDKRSRLYTPEDLELIVADSYMGGLVAEEEQQLVKNIFDFVERRVEQVMTPRTKVDAVPITINEQELIMHVINSPYSRLPVYEGSLDNITGVLHLKDLIMQQVEGSPFVLRKMLRDVPKVPTTLQMETLLNSLRQLRIHMAIVVDEHEGTAGIVTLEDLIEEVVGEVYDEFDPKGDGLIILTDEGDLLVDGSVPLVDLEEHVDLGSYSDNYDVETVGGLVVAYLNRPARVGDEAIIENVRFRVEAIDDLSVAKLRLLFQPKISDTNSTQG